MKSNVNIIIATMTMFIWVITPDTRFCRYQNNQRLTYFTIMIDENNFTELLHVKQLSMFHLNSKFQVGIIHYNVAKNSFNLTDVCFRKYIHFIMHYFIFISFDLCPAHEQYKYITNIILIH